MNLFLTSWLERLAPGRLGSVCSAPQSCTHRRPPPPLLRKTAGHRSSPKPASTTAPAALTDWPITRGGPALQGRVNAPAPQNPTIEWTFEMESPGSAEAAVAEGAILVGDAMGILYCIDFETRNCAGKWKPAIRSMPRPPSPTAAFSPAPATIISTRSTSRPAGNSGPSRVTTNSRPPRAWFPLPDGATEWVLVNGYDGTTRCLNATDGSEVWTYKTDDYINGTPAVIDGRLIAFGGCDKVIHVLNLADGKLVNEIVTDSQITNSVATIGTTIYCGNHANQLVAAEADADKLAWIYQASDFPFFTAPAVDDQNVYIGSRDKSLHAIKRADGTGAWTFKTGGRVESSPIAFDDAIVFGSSDGRLYAANPADGTELWRLDLGEDLTASPASPGAASSFGTLFRHRGPGSTRALACSIIGAD
jgi:eukaryotic-like serine/threonine-protein kinase